MMKNWRGIVTVLAFGSCVAMSIPSCIIRASATPVYVVDEEPPPPRYQTPAARSGYVWVRGHHEYRNSRWAWRAGHWQRARSGYAWQPGHWERRGRRHHWVEGRWVAGAARPAPGVRDHRRAAPPPRPAPAPAAYPSNAPPDPRYETPAGRSGYVWVRGHYEWRRGAYVWKRGHWKKARANSLWVAGHWELRGNRYVWVAGKWGAGKAKIRPGVRDHRKR